MDFKHTIEESNKLIANFLDWKKEKRSLPFLNSNSSGGYYDDWSKEEVWVNEKGYIITEELNLSFHFSWSMLRPVIEKILNLNLSESTGIHRVYFNTFRCRKDNPEEPDYKVRIYSDFKDLEIKTEGNEEIKVTYEAIIQFIRWYNEKH